MSETILSRPDQRVETPDAARFLTDANINHYLHPFLGQETSVGEAARQVGVTVQVMHYWVGRLVALGLVQVTREEPRRGRAIKHYRAVADAFFVPFAATPVETLEALLTQHDAWQQARFTRGLVKAFLEGVDDPLAWGVKVRAGGGRALEWGREDSSATCPLLEALQSAWAPPVFASWQSLALTHEEAKDLQKDLRAVWERYEKKLKSKGGSKRYVLRLGLAPTEG